MIIFECLKGPCNPPIFNNLHAVVRSGARSRASVGQRMLLALGVAMANCVASRKFLGWSTSGTDLNANRLKTW